MKAILVSILVGLFLVGCGGGAAVKSKQEARIHAAEKKRHGLMTNERYREEVQKIVSSELPEKSDSPIDVAAIRVQYATKARGNKSAAMTNAYNTGRLSKAKYGHYMAKERQNKYAAAALVLAGGLAAAGGGLSGSALAGTYGGGTGNDYRQASQSTSGHKYDPKTGNSYNYNTDSLGNTHIRGSNSRTGSNWSSTIDSRGNQRGYDSKMNAWTYNAITGSYYNYGTGRSCYGKGTYRQCY